jgi:hypothetical protein
VCVTELGEYVEINDYVNAMTTSYTDLLEQLKQLARGSDLKLREEVLAEIVQLCVGGKTSDQIFTCLSNLIRISSQHTTATTRQ